MNFRRFFHLNTWAGKLLGCFFGYLAAGPLGAFAGLIIGNFFDRGLVSHFNHPHFSFYQEKRLAAQKIYFEATFSVMGHIAKTDGRVSENDIRMARDMMDEMRLNPEQKKLAREYFNQGKQSTFNLEHMLNKLHNACHDNSELLKLFMDIQYRAAFVDGLSIKKFQLLDAVFRRLGFAPLNQQYNFYRDFGYKQHAGSGRSSSSSETFYHKTHQTELTQAFATLELKESASRQEVKQAYRRLISQNHPDKLIAKGLPEEMIKVANDKTQRITKAYEIICRKKGW